MEKFMGIARTAITGKTPVQLAFYAFAFFTATIFIFNTLFGGKKRAEKETPTTSSKAIVKPSSEDNKDTSSSASSPKATSPKPAPSSYVPSTDVNVAFSSQSFAASQERPTPASTTAPSPPAAPISESASAVASTTIADKVNASVQQESNDTEGNPKQVLSKEKTTKKKAKGAKGKSKSKGKGQKKWVPTSSSNNNDGSDNESSSSEASDSDDIVVSKISSSSSSSSSSSAVSPPVVAPASSSNSSKSRVNVSNRFGALTDTDDFDIERDIKVDEFSDKIEILTWETGNKRKNKQKNFRARDEFKSSEDLTAEGADVDASSADVEYSAAEVVAQTTSSSDDSNNDLESSALQLVEDEEAAGTEVSAFEEVVHVNPEPEVPLVEKKIEFTDIQLRGTIIGKNGKNRQDLLDLTKIKDLTCPKPSPNEPLIVTLLGEEANVAEAEKALMQLCEKGYSEILEKKKDPLFRSTIVRFFRTYLFEASKLLTRSNISLIKSTYNVHINCLNFPLKSKTEDAAAAAVAAAAAKGDKEKVDIEIAGSQDNVKQAKEVLNSIKKFYHHELTHPGLSHHELNVSIDYIKHIIGSKHTNKKQIEDSLNVTIYTPGKEMENANLVIVGPGHIMDEAVNQINKTIRKVDEVNQSIKLQEIEKERQAKAGKPYVPRKARGDEGVAVAVEADIQGFPSASSPSSGDANLANDLFGPSLRG